MRRAFLLRCGRFAGVTPPVITTLLTVSMIPSEVHASTIGRGNGRGGRSVIAIIINRLFGWLG